MRRASGRSTLLGSPGTALPWSCWQAAPGSSKVIIVHLPTFSFFSPVKLLTALAIKIASAIAINIRAIDIAINVDFHVVLVLPTKLIYLWMSSSDTNIAIDVCFDIWSIDTDADALVY